MFEAGLDRLIWGHLNRLNSLDPSADDYEYRKMVAEDELESTFYHEQIVEERRQLARNMVAFENALAKAEKEHRRQNM
ncbi:hypothetical protein [Desulfosporosinus shakirovi]|uniref:hypothetical protein n=1 Tax=Desulfosporosinus shakirovi TaxID=2885154 RepID=UPI001E506C18|nr:hypothetical protein [Desulfosporosinus sp. SRJS8]MCB8817355.1 hypothetical protein [Desulfosporosinus sp. SRJS8]